MKNYSELAKDKKKHNSITNFAYDRDEDSDIDLTGSFAIGCKDE